MNLRCKFTTSGLPILTVEDTEQLGSDFVKEHQPFALHHPQATDIQAIMHDDMEMTIYDRIITPDCSILGLISFDDLQIPIFDEFMKPNSLRVKAGNVIIDPRLKEVPTRYRFTLMHEVAHWELHKSLYMPSNNRKYIHRCNGYSYVACKRDPKEYGRKNPKQAVEDVEWGEWQADNFAGAVLMPRETFIPAAQDVMRKMGYRDLHIVAGRPDPHRIEVLNSLASMYQVSRRSAKIRMRMLGLYVEPSDKLA